MKREYNVVSAQEYYEGEIRNKRIGEWKALPDLPYMKNTPTQTTGYCVNIYEEEKQEIFGFGAAITEGAAFQYFNMDDINKVKALELLFGKSGLNYNLCRLCIGSSDFTIDEYSYVRDGDENLHTFTIERDKKYIVPFLKDIVKKREGESLTGSVSGTTQSTACVCMHGDWLRVVLDALLQRSSGGRDNDEARLP